MWFWVGQVEAACCNPDNYENTTWNNCLYGTRSAQRSRRISNYQIWCLQLRHPSVGTIVRKDTIWKWYQYYAFDENWFFKRAQPESFKSKSTHHEYAISNFLFQDNNITEEIIWTHLSLHISEGYVEVEVNKKASMSWQDSAPRISGGT